MLLRAPEDDDDDDEVDGGDNDDSYEEKEDDDDDEKYYLQNNISILTTSPVPQHPLYNIAHLKSMKQLHWVASYPTPSTIVLDMMMIVIVIIVMMMMMVIITMMVVIDVLIRKINKKRNQYSLLSDSFFTVLSHDPVTTTFLSGRYLMHLTDESCLPMIVDPDDP